MESNGRIMEIKRFSTQRIYGGIKGGRGYSRRYFGYYNGYGAFCEYPETHPVLVAYIYETEQVVEIDIKEEVKDASVRSIITESYLKHLKYSNEGKKIWFDDSNGHWDIQDYDDLEC